MAAESKIVEALRENLAAAGIGSGSHVLVHSGIRDLLPADPETKPAVLGRQVAEMLIDVVGPSGTIAMSTDGIRDPREFAYHGRVFDAERTPSRRGSVTEVFRQMPGVLRSRHPWCNASAWGRHAEWLLADHLKSSPFAMDRQSPWFRLVEIDADIVYIGERPHSADQSIILPQHVLGHDYPVPCFLDKAVSLRTRRADGSVTEIPVHLDVHDWRKSEVVAFIRHLDRTYGLHREFGAAPTTVVQCKAARHYEALMAELERGHAYPHMRYWL